MENVNTEDLGDITSVTNTALNLDASKDSLGSKCSGPTCRICRDTSIGEKLISPCYCTGTSGYVHLQCLEKWLSEAARRSCEVCLFEFKAKRRRKSFYEWLRSPRSQRERRFIYGDTTCFFLLTPLGAISSWLCFRGAHEYYNQGENWTGFGLIVLTGFLTLMYFFWVGITLRYHYYTFRKWQKQHTEIKLVLSDHSIVELRGRSVHSLFTRADECEDDGVEVVTEINVQHICANSARAASVGEVKIEGYKNTARSASAEAI